MDNNHIINNIFRESIRVATDVGETLSNDIIEVNIKNDYPGDKMWRAILLSIPSFWMTAYVFYRLRRLKMNKRSFVDSTPSHLWSSSEQE